MKINLGLLVGFIGMMAALCAGLAFILGEVATGLICLAILGMTIWASGEDDA